MLSCAGTSVYPLFTSPEDRSTCLLSLSPLSLSPIWFGYQASRCMYIYIEEALCRPSLQNFLNLQQLPHLQSSEGAPCRVHQIYMHTYRARKIRKKCGLKNPPNSEYIDHKRPGNLTNMWLKNPPTSEYTDHKRPENPPNM